MIFRLLLVPLLFFFFFLNVLFVTIASIPVISIRFTVARKCRNWKMFRDVGSEQKQGGKCEKSKDDGDPNTLDND